MDSLLARVERIFDGGATTGAFIAVVGVFVVGVGGGAFVSCKSSGFILRGISKAFEQQTTPG